MATTSGLGGFFTGLDTGELIQKILDVKKATLTSLQTQATAIDTQTSAAQEVSTSLTALKGTLGNLKNSVFFKANTVSSSTATVATATATTSSARSSYALVISNLPTSSYLKSGHGTALADKVATAITSSNPVTTEYGSSLTLGASGTFTVNGTIITITSGVTTLDDIITAIEAAPNISAATAYDPATDKINIVPSAGTAVVLGSPSDTSNFLSRSGLFTTGVVDGTVSTLTTLGRIDATQDVVTPAAAARIGTTVTAGTFLVNGITITVAAGESLNTILSNITGSAANVYATYDANDDRVVLTSKTTGNKNITVTAGTSNFATALKLNTSTSLSDLTAGTDMSYTINGGVARKSSDTTIDSTESGLVGVTITALIAGSTTLKVVADASTIQTEIDAFITQFNKTQDVINSHTVPPTKTTKSTDTESILVNDSAFRSLAFNNRNNFTGTYGSSSITSVSEIGILSTSSGNKLTSSSLSKITAFLTDNGDDLGTFFAGVANRLNTYLSTQTITNIPTDINNLLSQKTRIQTSINIQQAILDAEQVRLENSFSALEQFQAKSIGILNFFQNQKT